MNEIVCRYGAPKEILSDLGSSFNSKLFQSVCKQCNIRKIYSTPYHPQTQGIVERFNRTLLDMISTTVGPTKDWDLILPFLQFAYNSSIHETTGQSPYYMNYGRDPTTPCDLSMKLPRASDIADPDHYLEKMRNRLQSAWESAEHHILKSQQKSKTYYDSKKKEEDIQIGDLVSLKLPPKMLQGVSKKLHFKWTGPFRVKEMNLPNISFVPINKPNETPRKIHVNSATKFYDRLVPKLNEGPEEVDSDEEIDEGQ